MHIIIIIIIIIIIRNQPGEVLKRFLKFFLEMLYSIYWKVTFIN